MKTILHVSAPGKLILLGEHIVVYNKPALIASVAKRCHVTLRTRSDSNVSFVSKQLKESINLTTKDVFNKTRDAQKKWETFSATNDTHLLKKITENPLDYAIIALGEAMNHYTIPQKTGFTLSIDSEIPIGCGMGSSASLAIAIAGGVSMMRRNILDKECINTVAYSAEQKKHGFPSGGDNSACCYGGLIWYRRESPDLKIIKQIPFALSPYISKNFFTVFTGIPRESTGEMVSMVRTLYNKKTSQTEKILSNQETLVKNLLSALKKENHEGIISLMRNGERIWRNWE